MRKLLRSVLITFFTVFVYGYILSSQDSLLNIISSNVHDSIKIDALDQWCELNLGADPEGVIKYGLKAVELAEGIKDYKRLGYALKNVGLGHYFKAEWVDVLTYWRRSLEAFNEIDYPQGISNIESNLGAVYYSTGDNPSALDHYLKALRIAESSGDDKRRATVLQNIGAVYETIDESDLAEEYLLQALPIFEKLNDDRGIATTSVNLGEIYLENKNDIQKATVFFNIAKSRFIKIDDNLLPNVEIFLGQIEARKNNNAKALRSFNEAYDIAKSKGGKVAMAIAKRELGNSYVELGLPNQALEAYIEALEIGKVIGINDDYQKTLIGIIKAYKSQSDFLNVVKYQDSLFKVNEQIFDLEKADQLKNLELNFDIEKKESEIAILNAQNEVQKEQITRATQFRNFLMALAGLLLLIGGGIFYQYNFIRKTNKIITAERNKSDELLLNILPKETADELKENGAVKTKQYESVTVLFTDFVNFTGLSSELQPEELVRSMDYYFTHFDEIIGRFNMEKIKTIGDAYMCVGGVPKVNDTNISDAVKAAEAILKFVKKTRKNPPFGITPFKIRIGINSGPLVAGVVGTKKFQFDIWGDAVNIASRMETNCEPNQINVSENVYEKLKNRAKFNYRGEIKVKNKGKMKMYYFEEFSEN